MMNSVVCYLDRTAAQFPTRIAAADADRELTYEALRHESRAIGSALLARFGLCQTSEPVAVFLPKSVSSVCSFMGALYSGRCYVPLDYQSPDHRTDAILAHLRPRAVIADEASADRLRAMAPEGCDILLYDELTATTPDDDAIATALAGVTDQDPAYIMHTSGSTGVPKGVTIPHCGIFDYTEWLTDEFGLTEQSVLGLQSGFHFDNSVFDIYGCFSRGGRLEIIPEILFMYPRKLLGYLAEKKVTCVFWVPTVMISVANSGALEETPLPDLTTVVFAGEVMPNKQLNIWRRALPDRVFANLYGPTEITVDCTYYVVDREFDDADPLPIGIACPNTRILLLREDNTEAPDGEEGEICVIGTGLALGYWNAPELTEKVFVQNPLNTRYTERMYRTGDMGKRAPDGNILYCGRRDSQFKLRGNRIELGDIETAAAGIHGVSAVCALFDAAREQIILCITADQPWTLRHINVELGRLLPKYMLPGRLEQMDAFPLTPNRKIDRRRLKELLCKED